MIMDLFSNLQLLHEAAISVLVTTLYGRWRGTITDTGAIPREQRPILLKIVFLKHLLAGSSFYPFLGNVIL